MAPGNLPSLSEVRPPAVALAAGWALAGATVLLATGAVDRFPGVDPLWIGTAAVATLAAGAARVSWPSARRVARLAGAAAVYGTAVAVLLWLGLGGVDLSTARTGAVAMAVASGGVWAALGAVAVPRHWPASRPGWWPAGSDERADEDRGSADVRRERRQWNPDPSVTEWTLAGLRSSLAAGGGRLSYGLVLAGAALVALSVVVHPSPVPGEFVTGRLALAALGVGLATTTVGLAGLNPRGALAVAAVALNVVSLSVAGTLAGGALVSEVGSHRLVVLVGVRAPAGVGLAALVLLLGAPTVSLPVHWLLRDRSKLRPTVEAAGPGDALLAVGLMTTAAGLALPVAGPAVVVGAALALLGAFAGTPAVVVPAFRLTVVPALPLAAARAAVEVRAKAAGGAADAVLVAWAVALLATGGRFLWLLDSD